MKKRVLGWRSAGLVLLYTLALAANVGAQKQSIQEAEKLSAEVKELYSQGQYEKAIPLAVRVLRLHENLLGPEHPDTATALTTLGALYHATGAYAQAEPVLQRALAIREKTLGPEHLHTATALNSLAELYYDNGAYAQAEPLFQRTVSIREKTLGPEHPDTATALNNLAVLYHTAGAYAQAEPVLQRALAIREKTLGPEHPDTATALNSLAGLFHTTGAYAQAEPLFQRVLAIREKTLGPEHPDTAAVIGNLGLLYHATGVYAQAEALYQRALEIQEKNTARFLLSGSEARKQAYIQQLAGHTFSNVSFAVSVASSQAIVLGLTSVLRYKGRVLDAMSDSVARLRQSVKPEDRGLFEQLAGVAQQRSTLTFQGIGKLPPEAYRRRLDELAQQQETLEIEIATRSAEFRQQFAPITLAAVRQLIPSNTVLVEWFRYRPSDPKAQNETRWDQPRYLAYVLTHVGEPVVVDMGEAAAVESLVREFRIAASDPDRTDVKELAAEVFEQLFKPLRPYVDNAERVLIAPDGALYLVPFAALLDDTGKYLAERFEITFLTSGRDLLRVASASSPRSITVVVADPAYGERAALAQPGKEGLEAKRVTQADEAIQVFTPLPGTAAEANALKALLKLPDHAVLTGANATEARLKHLHGPRILHVATHGFFLRDQPMAADAYKPVGFAQDQRPVLIRENPLLRSGLALAGASARHSGTDDDGILTAFEVAQLDLRGTELVILSACETGIGELQHSEGVYGLRRALVLAGAQTHVTSLWKVADDATKDLMVEYYRGLLKGQGRSEALREVQKAMIASQDRWHPYYWAAFVPIGNWAPLPVAHE